MPKSIGKTEKFMIEVLCKNPIIMLVFPMGMTNTYNIKYNNSI